VATIAVLAAPPGPVAGPRAERPSGKRRTPAGTATPARVAARLVDLAERTGYRVALLVDALADPPGGTTPG
jgi:hypothetical protein